MTDELARTVATVPGVERLGDALLSRRLERLRAAGAARSTTPPLATPPVGTRAAGEPLRTGTATRARDRAERLAADLGGRVEETPAGPVTVLESVRLLPAALASLTRLPFPIDPARPIVCLDTETTGLGTGAGTVAFLVGMGEWDGDRFRVRQFFLPDQPDEAALLAAVSAAIPPDAWLVTYNGRSFDWPLLVARYRLHGRPAPALAGHLDLLPVARLLWRHRLPDARLASVEDGVAGVRRGFDLPGALVPDRYFTYLRTGRGAPLVDVAEHNRQDVVSLALLLVILAERYAADEARRGAHPGDLAALGRAYARAGARREGLACIDLALELTGSVRWYRRVPHLEESLLAERARLLGRLGARDEAASSWLALAQEGGRMAALGWIQVAKHREHRERDPRGALEAADRAGALGARARFVGHDIRWLERDLARRLPRLRRRMRAVSLERSAAR